MKAIGEEQQIPELTTPMLQLGDIDGHTLAMLASGVCQANAYYRCPYEGGAAVVLIKDENFPRDDKPALVRIASVFPQAISALGISNHKHALAGYLEYCGLVGQENGGSLIVKENDETVLTATFDEQERLTNLEAKLMPVLPSA